MERRKFLSAYKKPVTKKTAPFSTMAAQSSSTGLTPYTGLWTENEIIHLLKRTMFGSKKDDINYFKNRTLNQAVDELINPTAPLPAAPLKDYDTIGALTLPDTNIAAGTTWVNDVNNDGAIQSRRRASFKKWWIGNMVNQDRSIREKMALFWHNHFSTETSVVVNPQYIYKHHQSLRAGALGNFKSLVRAVTIDPAMLVFLNGQFNSAAAPDENYGRELQELFCCGKGAGSQYTESDVKAAARVLTGWQNNAAIVSSNFNANRHDTTNKQFSAFYNSTIITGKSGATAGNEELDALLTMIFNTQEVSKYICRCLYRWFVYYEIDITIETNIIEPLAAILRNNNYEIKPVLGVLFKSEHFFDPLNQGCVIKSPVDLVVGMCRELNVQFQPATDFATNYGFYNFLLTAVSNMQQNIGDPPDVSGWKAYYQAPQFHEIWINSDTLPKRNQFTDTMVVSGYTFNGKKMIVDGAEFLKILTNPSDPNALIDDVLRVVFRIPLSAATRKQLKTDIILSGQANDAYWTAAWNQYVTNPADMANTTIVKNRARDLLKYLMDLAEYQLS
ncbi:MAG: DUF1800 domain-containing protein [Bacteroidota bacterium]|nr:DUF1800 domain-containing protein [Bacteroidota bacterium]